MPNQRDVVEIFDRLPNGKVLNHPVIILSTQAVIDQTEQFLGVMMTSSGNYDDQFSYWITHEMFTRPLPKSGCQLRLHLISLYRVTHIYRDLRTRMKIRDFEALMDEVFRLPLGIDYEDV